jgi:hypothetical protein
MITIDKLMSLEKQQAEEEARKLAGDDLAFLVGLLSEKVDKIRYAALLLLQGRSAIFSDVYPYWDVFVQKLNSDNSYQRSIGLMLIAENARWDTENRMEEALEAYLKLLHDEKPITVRQCIQALHKIIPHKGRLTEKVADALVSLKLSEIRGTMQKSVLTDILGVLAVIRRQKPSEKIDEYVVQALSGDILDRKTKKEIEKLLAAQ